MDALGGLLVRVHVVERPGGGLLHSCRAKGLGGRGEELGVVEAL